MTDNYLMKLKQTTHSVYSQQPIKTIFINKWRGRWRPRRLRSVYNTWRPPEPRSRTTVKTGAWLAIDWRVCERGGTATHSLCLQTSIRCWIGAKLYAYSTVSWQLELALLWLMFLSKRWTGSSSSTSRQACRDKGGCESQTIRRRALGADARHTVRYFFPLPLAYAPASIHGEGGGAEVTCEVTVASYSV